MIRCDAIATSVSEYGDDMTRVGNALMVSSLLFHGMVGW
jgi:hypothetical protein